MATQLGPRIDEHPDNVYVFRGRRGDLVKILWATEDRIWLLAKRLERGRFIWPQADGGKVHLTCAQLSTLLEGIDWRQPRRTAALSTPRCSHRRIREPRDLLAVIAFNESLHESPGLRALIQFKRSMRFHTGSTPWRPSEFLHSRSNRDQRPDRFPIRESCCNYYRTRASRIIAARCCCSWCLQTIFTVFGENWLSPQR